MRYHTTVLHIVILLCFIKPIDLWTQMTVIQGTVVDMATNERLISATVQWGTKATVTDYNGNFKLGVEAGTQTLTISYIGYKSYRTELTIQEGQDQSIDIQLELSNSILETAVVTGSKYEQNILEVPVSMAVIKPDIVAANNTASISDFLDKVGGVQIIDGQANIRGGSGYSYGAGSRVMLLIDDMPAMQPDAGRPLWGDIPTENISQIEIIKGAASAQYGSAALNGIINIRTSYATSIPETKAFTGYTLVGDPRDKEKKWWSTAPYTFNAGLLHKQKFGKFDVVANAYHERGSGPYQDEFIDMYRAGLNVRYRLSDRLSLKINTLYNQKESNSPFVWSSFGRSAYIPFGDQSIGKNKRFYIDPVITYFDKKGNRHRFQSRYFTISNDQNNNQSNSSQSIYSEYQFLKKWDKIDLTFSTGAVSNTTFTSAELFSDTSFTAQNFAAFVQFEKAFGPLSITSGARIEYNEQTGPRTIGNLTIPNGRSTESRIIPRLGVHYKLKEYTHLRASVGQGYRYPTISEKYINTQVSGINIFPNPLLESETGWSSELGIYQAYAFGSMKGLFDLSIFWSQYFNMTEFTTTITDGGVGFQSQNVGDTDIKGAELSLQGNIDIKFPINYGFSYTYLIPRYTNYDDSEQIQSSLDVNQNFLKYRSKHLFKFDVSTKIKSFSLGVHYRRASHMITIDKQLSDLFGIGVYRRNKANGYHVIDTRLAYDFSAFQISFVVNNLLNSEYSIRPGILDLPRNYSVRFNASF